MTPLKTIRTMPVSAIFRKFGSCFGLLVFCRTFLEPGWVSNQKRKQKIFNEQK
jgi:hypothetical protein